MMAMTIATSAGRRRIGHAIAPSLREGLGRNRTALLDGRRRADDDLLAGLDAILDDLQVADAIPDGDDRTITWLFGEHLDLIAALEIGTAAGNARAHDAPLVTRSRPVLAGPKNVCRGSRIAATSRMVPVHGPRPGQQRRIGPVLESTSIAQGE